MNSEYCVCCGTEIPEGRQVCPDCEAKVYKSKDGDNDEKRKTYNLEQS